VSQNAWWSSFTHEGVPFSDFVRSQEIRDWFETLGP